MYTKEEIWAAFAKELMVIRHLAGKMLPNTSNYKPTEKQRTMLELLQYLSVTGTGTMRAVLENNSDLFTEYATLSHETTVENFIAKMEEQEIAMHDLFVKFTDADFATVITRFGTTQSKALFILDLLKSITAYKMQLFLYIKASGNASIVTSNLWAGRDMPAAQA